VTTVCADGFTEPSSWATYDPGTNGVGTDPDGYDGAAFDGRYVYFAPRHNGYRFHGEVLRHDTAQDFSNVSAWGTCDYGEHCGEDCADPDGYIGAVFDGRYVYFVPTNNGDEYHGEVLRYDTTGDFANTASWATYDAKYNSPGAIGGYAGAVFDGRYVYFVPYRNAYSGPRHGEVLRYDTADPDGFTDPVAGTWTTYDAKNNPPGAKGGYHGGAFDGHYVYFAPYYDGTEYHGDVLRYDTLGDFAVSSSWTVYDVKTNNPPGALGGYIGTVFDGRFVYFGPHETASGYHGEVLRYDTQTGFDDASSWATYDATGGGSAGERCGYYNAVFDGRYVYFVPHQNNTEHHGQVLQYDVTEDFHDPSAWNMYDYGEHCGEDCTDPDGYRGAILAGGYIYFAPAHNGTDYHGEVLRYHALAGPPIPTVSQWGMAAMTLLELTVGTLVFVRRRTTQT
jgi:hypothetical protein